MDNSIYCFSLSVLATVFSHSKYPSVYYNDGDLGIDILVELLPSININNTKSITLCKARSIQKTEI